MTKPMSHKTQMAEIEYAC